MLIAVGSALDRRLWRKVYGEKWKIATGEVAARRIDRATLNHSASETRGTRGALLPARALSSAYFRRLESRCELAFLFR